jgi:hypothetical protein
MDYLVRKLRKKDFSLYKIGPDGKGVKRYVISTPQTRKICNSPEIMGFEYIDLLQEGMKKILENLPFHNFDDKSVCILHFLRGGLNFGLLFLLNKVYGFNKHSSSFITSQRYRKKGNWSIKLDQYRKFSVPQGANIFLGDVIATGTTLENGLRRLYRSCKEEKKNIRNFIVFTIGCYQAEDILEEFDKLFKKSFNYQNTYLYYLEGRFGLPEKRKDFNICLPGTDLIRHPALLAPEFELSQYERLSFPLERCAIYDMGSRAFECLTHLKDVADYWKELSLTGMTLYEAYKERWPEEDYESFGSLKARKKKTWKNVNSKFIRDLYKTYKKRWTPKNIREAKKKDSLKTFCAQRITQLREAMK